LKSDLLARYLADKCTTEEIETVEEWLGEDSYNHKLMKEFEKIWKISPQISSIDEQFDIELDWAVLQSRIEEESHFNTLHLRSSNRFELSRWFVLAKFAAIFVVALLIGINANKLMLTDKQEVTPVLREISMDKGQRGSVSLSDGTKVFLNSESKITLPNVFEDDIRKVYLEGEAYFDVVKNPQKPFIIETRGTIVEVLGTSFSIRSYPEENNVTTVVEEGVVSFRGSSGNEDNSVILTAGILGAFDTKQQSITTSEVDNLELYLGWKNGYLIFQDAYMDKVRLALERKYDIQVEFETEDIAALKLTAEFKSRMLKNNLETISMSLNLQYQIEEDVVYFSKKDL
jgi:transmembrane sensor